MQQRQRQLSRSRKVTANVDNWVLADTRLAPPALECRLVLLLADCSRPIIWPGHRLVVSASAGMAPADDPYRYDAEALFVMADAALYAAKAAGRGAVRTACAVGRPSGRRRATDFA